VKNENNMHHHHVIDQLQEMVAMRLMYHRLAVVLQIKIQLMYMIGLFGECI
jgi:hypothetical protein